MNEFMKCAGPCGHEKHPNQFPRGRKICRDCSTILRRERYKKETEESLRKTNRWFSELISWQPPAQI